MKFLRMSSPLSRHIQTAAASATTATAASQQGQQFSEVNNEPGAQRLLASKYPISADFLNPFSAYNLSLTLAPFLPSKKNHPFSLPVNSAVLPPSYHLAFFNDPLDESILDSDGYDSTRSPSIAPDGSKTRWTRRMWAGGSVTHRPFAVSQLKTGRVAYCAETVESVDIKKGSKPIDDKLFVWFKRKMWSGMPLEDGHLDRTPIELPDGECPVIERRCLVYMPERTADEVTKPRVIKPPNPATFSHTFTPTSTLLFRYSALTFNAHKIHLDRLFAREEESHPDLIVHGPLMMTFLLELLRINLSGTGQLLKTFEYRNLAPLYVDKPIKICGRQVTGAADVETTYELWAETPDGGYAVKGTAVTQANPGGPKL